MQRVVNHIQKSSNISVSYTTNTTAIIIIGATTSVTDIS
jgi:hypothetical protein